MCTKMVKQWREYICRCYENFFFFYKDCGHELDIYQVYMSYDTHCGRSHNLGVATLKNNSHTCITVVNATVF